MKSRAVILIGFLASLAILILLAMQLYWINTAAKIKEKNFEHNVSDAVENTIYKLEKIEIARSIKNRIKTYPKESAFFNNLDSISEFFSKYYRYFKDSSDDDYVKIKKLNVINDIFKNVLTINSSRLIEKRVNVNEIDSLLSEELKNKDIYSSYEFGVFSGGRHSLVMQKTGNYTSELLNKSLKFSLFPGDIKTPQDYLYIYFPNHTTYILKNIWGILLISGLLVGILVFIFTYTITTLIKQKKLADLKSDLMNNITHEFKTPISTIAIACEALNDDELKKSTVLFNNYVNIIREENKRLEIMAENVLQAAVIENGHIILEKEALSIHELITGVINSIKLQVEKKNGEITTEFLSKHDVINADKIHLTGVFYNLLDNACKYSYSNPKIIVKTENINEGIIISVSDNGIGISRKNQKKIFDTLYRVPTGNIHDTKGFGLGLGYVKAIVELHGGSISVESDLKRGATFKILLPFY